MLGIVEELTSDFTFENAICPSVHPSTHLKLSPLISFYNLIFCDGAPTKGHLQGHAPAFLMHHCSLNVEVDVAPLLLKGIDIKG